MNMELIALALFIVAAILPALLALLLWRPARALAISASGLAAFAALCIASEFASRAAHASIRVDLLFTIPLVSAGSAVVGLLAIRRAGLAVRSIAAPLACAGVISFGAFTRFAITSSIEGARLTARFDRARKLYSEETLRCDANLAKRFGSLTRRDNSCYGNLVVKERSAGAYPFTRAIVNDTGEVYLLFASGPGVEDNADLSDGPSARLISDPQGDLISAPGASGPAAAKIRMRALPGSACEARVERYGSTSVLKLARAELPPCNEPAASDVRFVGAWGDVAVPANSPQARRLTQIWLWETDGTARGLFLGNLAPTGARIPFQFAKQLQGTRLAGNRWELRPVDEGKYKYDRPFVLTIEGSRARLSGPNSLLRAEGEVALESREAISHPKIALVPLRDRERFIAYFDDVLFDLNVPWTAP